MGITFSAAGTSFPNLFASMVVARQGLGNMAVSNALGGNGFNIFMGLGLPWLLYAATPTTYMDDVHLHMYYGMSAGGVVFPVIILLTVLFGFLVTLAITGMRLYKIHAYICAALYVA